MHPDEEQQQPLELLSRPQDGAAGDDDACAVASALGYQETPETSSPGEHGALGHRTLVEIQRNVGGGLDSLFIRAISFDSAPHPRATHLDPLYNSGHVLRLQQELLALHPHPDDVLALRVVARKPALRVLQRILAHEVAEVGLRDRLVSTLR